jgi:hypothetical protein
LGTITKMKEYTFRQGFTIKVRKETFDVFYAMGEIHVSEGKVFDLYEGKEFIETYETFDEAKQKALELNP